MRIAYLILAHKNPKQFKRLLSKLDGDIYVHIDSKCDLKDFYIDNHRIFYIKERVSINWGGYSMIDATLKLINSAKVKMNYDFYILLSGDDYPIKKSLDFKLFLNANRDYSFMEYAMFDEKWQHSKRRYENYKITESNNIAIKILQKILNLFIKNRSMYKNLVAYKGSQWWCLNSESVEYVLHYIRNNNDILSYFRHTFIPDEMFFQTILLNSNLKSKISNDNLRYILLEGMHPEILTKDDYKDLIGAKNKFFARKFDSNLDAEILDLLDIIQK